MNMIKEKKFIIEDDNLMKEWNWDKNNELGLNPSLLTLSCHKKAFWKCEKNHIYQSIINDKVRRSQKCPVCQNKIIVKGINDFESNFPNLMKDWNFIKNKDIQPDNVSLNSSKKIWWLCHKCNHEWQTTISHRTTRNQSCPVCVNRIIKVGVNDLKTTNPSLASEWDYEKNDITPEQVTAGSHSKAWWICNKCGNKWQAQIKSRNNGCGCPICSRKNRKKPLYIKSRELSISYEKSLEFLFPEIAKEWDYSKNTIKPNQVGSTSKLRVWWKCIKCNYEYERQICNRTKRNNGCPKCSTKNSTRVNIGVNDLKSQNPRIANEWNYEKNGNLTPEMITVNSGQKVWWICPVGHEYQAVIRDRNSGTNCPICNKRNSSSFPEQAIYFYIKKAFPDAINKYKDIFKNSMELDVYIPSKKIGIEYDGKYWHSLEEIHERELKKYEICKQHNIMLIRIKENHKNVWQDTADSTYILKKQNDKKLLERYIYHILSLIDIDLSYIFDKSYTKPTFYNKISVDIERDKNEICSYLSNVENSIAILYPRLVEEWDYEKNGNLKPEMFTAGSNEKVWWKCKVCGYNWQNTINARTPPRNIGCSICGKDKRGKTFHMNYLKRKGSLLETNPSLAEDWHPTKNTISINDITESSPKKVWWLCKKCGHEWFTSPNNRSRGIGCPCCYGRVPKQGVNDLETLFPEISKKWNYEKNKDLTPNMVKPGSGKNVWWKCNNCKYEWQAIIREIVGGRKKCPNCKNS